MKINGEGRLLLGAFRKNLPCNSRGKNCANIGVEVTLDFQRFNEKQGNELG